MRDGWDVETARGDIGRDERTYLPLLKDLKRPDARAVRLVAMNALGVDVEA